MKRPARDEVSHDDESRDPQLQSAFRRSVDDGRTRLTRSWPNLLATGFVGGIDIGIGVLALLVVEAETGSRVLGAIAFGIGFIALTLGRSELFTESFLVPVATVVSGHSTARSLLRLWVGTLVANLAGGYVVASLLMGALPRLAETARHTASFYSDLGIGWTSFSLGLVGGMVITVMTWMERGSSTEFGRIVAALSAGFLLAAAPLNHVIVVSLEMFAALQVGASFGYADWAGTAAWAALANLVGGLLLVTVLRFVQVGGEEISHQRRRADGNRASVEAGRAGEHNGS